MSVKVGDKIRITNSMDGEPYENGEEYVVTEVRKEDYGYDVWILFKHRGDLLVCYDEYEVISEEDDSVEKAQKGDLIRVVAVNDSEFIGTAYAVGEILEVSERRLKGNGDDENDFVITTGDCRLYDNEYVIHRKAGEEDSEVIAGVGPDAPIVTNEVGAKQSHSPYRMDLIDAKALLKIAQVHKQGGDKYGDTNWRGIPVNDHINHALVHIYAHLAGDTSDEHLSHAATRMIFALAQELDAKSTQD